MVEFTPQIPGTNKLNPSIFEESYFEEVFRSLDVKMVVTKTIPDPGHPKRPIICFAGEVAHGSSAMSGQVKMTPDGQVRWQYVSVNYYYEEPEFRVDLFILLRSAVTKDIRCRGALVDLSGWHSLKPLD